MESTIDLRTLRLRKLEHIFLIEEYEHMLATYSAELTWDQFMRIHNLRKANIKEQQAKTPAWTPPPNTGGTIKIIEIPRELQALSTKCILYAYKHRCRHYCADDWDHMAIRHPQGDWHSYPTQVVKACLDQREHVVTRTNAKDKSKSDHQNGRKKRG